MTAAHVLRGDDLESLDFILMRVLGDVDGYCLPGTKPDSWMVEPVLLVPKSTADRLLVGDQLVLTDPENTPLGVVDISSLRPDQDRGSWVSGTASRAKNPEHGPARAERYSASHNLSERVVAIFSNDLHAVDILRAEREAQGRPLELVAVGDGDSSSASRLVSDLQKCASLIPSAHVTYVPSVRFGNPSESADVVLHLIDLAGAASVVDLRQSTTARHKGAVLLLTGLSGAGKSTVARALTERIVAAGLSQTVLLDGDEVRHELAGELGFSRDDRDRNLQRIAWVAARIAEVGGVAVCAPIAPFEASRAAMRAKVEPASPFIVVYVSTPLAVAEARDRKGLYQKARAGLIKDFTGIDSPYEVPVNPDVILDTSQLSVEECVARILESLRAHAIFV